MTSCAPSSHLNAEVHSNKNMIVTITSILTEIVEENKKNPSIKKEFLDRQKKLSFHSKKPASIEVNGYLERILKYTHIEESTLIIALIFIDRICELNNVFLMDSNIHRILFSSIIMALKYNEDDYYTNSYYSKVGGITIKELNTLEYEYVKLLKYSLFIKNEIFEKYQNYLTLYQKK